jgi:hypothetical protein
VLRTITDILGLDHLGIFDANAAPMTDVFDLGRTSWTFKASASGLLATTQLPIPKTAIVAAALQPTHTRRGGASKPAGWTSRPRTA